MNSNSNITDSAFIADLTIRSPVSGRCDNDLTAEVEAKHKLSGGGRWVKAIYSKEHLAEVRTIIYRIRENFIRYSLPWRAGQSIITSTAYPKFIADHNRLVNEAEKAFDKLRDQFDAILSDAAQRLNGTFDRRDYPATAEAFRSQFGVELELDPLPSPDRLPNDLREKAEFALGKRIRAARSALLERLSEALRGVAEVLADRKKIFRNSTIEAARQALADADALNVGNDPDIARAVSNARQSLDQFLAEGKEDELRHEPQVRVTAASEALKAVNAFEQIAASIAASK